MFPHLWNDSMQWDYDLPDCSACYIKGIFPKNHDKQGALVFEKKCWKPELV